MEHHNYKAYYLPSHPEFGDDYCLGEFIDLKSTLYALFRYMAKRHGIPKEEYEPHLLWIEDRITWDLSAYEIVSPLQQGENLPDVGNIRQQPRERIIKLDEDKTTPDEWPSIRRGMEAPNDKEGYNTPW